MKEINYDEVLSPPKLKITIGGKTYEVDQPSIQQILDYEQRVKELSSACKSNVSGGDVGEGWIEIIRSIFTCIPVKALKEKSLPVLRKITKDCTKFMQESMYEDAPEGDKKKET